MKRLGPIVLTLIGPLAIAAGAQHPTTQQPATRERAANGPLAKLRDDVMKAVPNATFTDKQRDTLTRSVATLKDVAQAKRSGEAVDRDDVKKAFKDIKSILESGAFQPDDAKVIKADLAAIEEAAKKAKREALRRRFRGSMRE